MAIKSSQVMIDVVAYPLRESSWKTFSTPIYNYTGKSSDDTEK